MNKKRAPKKKPRYLTVHVKPSSKLRSTVVVSIPHEFYFAEELPDCVSVAISQAQAHDLGMKNKQ